MSIDTNEIELKTYRACVGVYVRAYFQFECEAESDDKAKDAAIQYFKDNADELPVADTDWSNKALPALCYVSDEEGKEDIAEGIDFALNSDDSRQFASGDLLAALKFVVESEYDRDEESRNFNDWRLEEWAKLIAKAEAAT